MSESLHLDPVTKAKYRAVMEYDPWIFSLTICKRTAHAERHQRPLLYLYTRHAPLLCACLDNPKYDGPITDQVKEDFANYRIEWWDQAELPRVQKRLRRINVRMPRGFGKSAFDDDCDLWSVTCDPNLTISIGSKSDEFAEKRIVTIGQFVLSPEYAFWFPDRVPDNPRTEVTAAKIWIKGRTRHVPEATIEGRGLLSQWAGSHYLINRRDDIVGTESGESSLDDALRHMANMSALRDRTAWVGDTFIGTVNGEEDDHTILANDSTVLSVVVPMEIHEGGTTLENIYEDGTLTMPEVFSREEVNEAKVESRSNPKYGALWLLQNFYMAAHKSGTAIFSAKMIERAKFEWVDHDEYGKALKREIIRRPKKGMEKIPRSQLKPSDWFYLDPLLTIPQTAKATAVDQAVSESGESDRWAQVYVCADWESVFYVLDSLAEHGYGLLMGELVPFHKGTERKAIRGDVGISEYVGIDSNSTQGMTAVWLKDSEAHKAIARKVREIRGNDKSKDINIRNWIQARMLTGEFYINPRLTDWTNEALCYRPYKQDGTKKRRPKDDQLDATWMAMTLVRIPVSPEVNAETEIEERMSRIAEAKHYDRQTGICTDDWMGELRFGRSDAA